jgi:F-type H+-transporting ATPase subunit a
VISFAFRLFGNIFAGEVLLTVIAFISGSYLFFAPLPFYGLEVFVGLIQALVFSILSLVFFNMATINHNDH